jgi:hypothetical protein
LFKKVTQGDEVYQRNLRTKTSPADVIMWSGSKDSQTSYVPPVSIFNLAPLPYQNPFQFPHLPFFKGLWPWTWWVVFLCLTKLIPHLVHSQSFPRLEVVFSPIVEKTRFRGDGLRWPTWPLVSPSVPILVIWNDNMLIYNSQSWRIHCRRSYRCHVLGLHLRTQKEPTAVICAAAKQYQRRVIG